MANSLFDPKSGTSDTEDPQVLESELERATAILERNTSWRSSLEERPTILGKPIDPATVPAMLSGGYEYTVVDGKIVGRNTDENKAIMDEDKAIMDEDKATMDEDKETMDEDETPKPRKRSWLGIALAGAACLLGGLLAYVSSNDKTEELIPQHNEEVVVNNTINNNAINNDSDKNTAKDTRIITLNPIAKDIVETGTLAFFKDDKEHEDASIPEVQREQYRNSVPVTPAERLVLEKEGMFESAKPVFVDHETDKSSIPKVQKEMYANSQEIKDLDEEDAKLAQAKRNKQKQEPAVEKAQEIPELPPLVRLEKEKKRENEKKGYTAKKGTSAKAVAAFNALKTDPEGNYVIQKGDTIYRIFARALGMEEQHQRNKRIDTAVHAYLAKNPMTANNNMLLGENINLIRAGDRLLGLEGFIAEFIGLEKERPQALAKFKQQAENKELPLMSSVESLLSYDSTDNGIDNVKQAYRAHTGAYMPDPVADILFEREAKHAMKLYNRKGQKAVLERHSWLDKDSLPSLLKYGREKGYMSRTNLASLTDGECEFIRIAYENNTNDQALEEIRETLCMDVRDIYHAIRHVENRGIDVKRKRPGKKQETNEFKERKDYRNSGPRYKKPKIKTRFASSEHHLV